MLTWPTPIVIVISGKAGSGKRLVADYLSSFKIPYTKMQITLPLKKMIAELTSTSLLDNIYQKDIVVSGISLAQHQEIAAKSMRKIGGDCVFVTYLIKEIEASCYPYIVIDDVQLLAEVEALTKLRAHFIRINRPSEDREPLLYGRNLKARTEVELDDYDGFDLVVDNRSTIEEMQMKVNEYLSDNHFSMF